MEDGPCPKDWRLSDQVCTYLDSMGVAIKVAPTEPFTVADLSRVTLWAPLAPLAPLAEQS